MKITKYGKDVVLKMLIITILIDLIAFLIPNVIIKIILFTFSILLFGFTLWFFRDPTRKLPSGINENTIISPADGKVVLIEEIENKEDNLFKKGEKLKQVSIFLSPLNVHVNCHPVTGIVDYFKYIEGEYLVAFDHKSSERNERTEIGIKTINGNKILFKQIAGFVARRIVCNLKTGDEVYIGEKFGMIKFGSRVDMLFDINTKIFVKPGDKTKTGETIIGEFQS
ncbi:MAG TPA: phosphatidylserine decarboxylase family protein [Bacteroidetes bacterium]|nr:phosphatidylserine decarboxylase family protein [Bacteroidota bacterium]